LEALIIQNLKPQHQTVNAASIHVNLILNSKIQVSV